MHFAGEINKGQRGFTMVELMITLAIAGVVMIGVMTTFRSQQKSYTTQEEVVVMQQNLRAAINQMSREIRMATYDPVTNAGGITTAQANLLIFSSEIDNAGTLRTIQYDLYDAYGDGDTDIGRAVNGNANKRALAENIDALEFVYVAEDSALPLLPDNVATIVVSALARADRPDTGFVNTLTYTAVSGTVWGPFNDNFRRRLLTTTIDLRN